MKRNPRGRSNPAVGSVKSSTTPIVKTLKLRVVAKRPRAVTHLAMPPSFRRPRRIHSRHLLPLIKEGAERAFHSLSPRTILRRPMALAIPRAAAADDLTVVLDTELVSPGQQHTASNVGEPSAAINGGVVVYTGNWYAAVSTDGGRTFNYIDPTKEFPGPNPDSQFCCDQVVNYIPQIDTFVWLLQYGPDTGNNFQRLAFAKTADVSAGRWRLFDITAQSIGAAGAFLDFPDVAVGANYLYVTTNIFNGADAGTAVVRIALKDIAPGPTTAEHFTRMDLQSFRVAQNCGTTAYFAAHQDTSTLNVFAWDESAAAPVAHSVGVARWIGGNGYQSRTPDGHRWLDRADPRLTGATMTGNELWFGWTVDRGSNQRDKPFVQIARIDSRNMTLLENVNLFDADSAIAYAGLATNANNEVGVSYMIGGGTRAPSHAVGILTGTRQDHLVAAGDRGPLDSPDGKGEWGDFLTVRPVFPERKLFAATGYTLEGTGDESASDATPRFVIFGRTRDLGAVPGAMAARRPSAPHAAGDDGPFSDVDTLPTVSAAVAEQIKTAAGIGQAAILRREAPPPALPELVTQPGIERWPVKTGTDQDVARVGKNVIGDQDLGRGIVDTTVEELVSVPRPSDMPDLKGQNPGFQDRRSQPVETTVWRLEAMITALKLEADGDYHLVLQGASGETMIGEIPTPTAEFIGACPWPTNIAAARQAVDDRLLHKIAREDFVQMGTKLVPRGALSGQMQAAAVPAPPMLNGAPGQMPEFKTRIEPTRVRITGAGFFDAVHGQMGVSSSNGIELHPVLKIEWL